MEMVRYVTGRESKLRARRLLLARVPFLSFLYVSAGAGKDREQASRAGDRCHSRLRKARASARIPARGNRAQQPEQSPGPEEPASCARKGKRPARRSADGE